MSYVISKPRDMSGYDVHRVVAGVTGGVSAVYVDDGDQVVINTPAKVELPVRPERKFSSGDVVAFKLKACVGKKIQGRHIYFDLRDIESRRKWINRHAEMFGFSLVTVYIKSAKELVQKTNREFYVDSTTFVGVLQVLDEVKFSRAVSGGVGNKARAFGFGFLSI